MPWPNSVPVTEPPEEKGAYMVFVGYWTYGCYAKITDATLGWFGEDAGLIEPTHYMPQPPAPRESQSLMPGGEP